MLAACAAVEHHLLVIEIILRAKYASFKRDFVVTFNTDGVFKPE